MYRFAALLCLVFASTPLWADQAEHFEQHVRPILAAKCLKCHGEKKQEGNLRLDSRSAMLNGGDSGPAVVPGSATDSLLIEAVNYASYEMPPTGQLSAKEIDALQRWVAGGAVWPQHAEPLREISGLITEADRDWWAFRPVVKSEAPTDPDDSWSSGPIDRFVYRRIKEEGLQPAPQASREALVRRLYFDLIGLPPTVEQIEEFVNDDSPGAWESLIDRLLDDPRYGEHWARPWLDLVRYAESDGWNQDAYRENIWRYRDYVVNSFNEDKPYPKFVMEQLAGDEMPGDDPQSLVATGFLRLGIYEYNQRDARSHWDDIMNEMTDVVGDVFLGMGMACARCHDHKFDPVLQADYFRLRAFFEPIVWRDDIPGGTAEEKAAYQEKLKEWEEATKEIRGEIDELLQPYYDRKWESTVEKFPLDIQACFHKPVEERTSREHQMAYLVSRQFWEEGGGPLRSMKKEDKQKHEALKKELAKFDDIKPEPLPELMTATDFSGELSPTLIPGDPEKKPIEPGFLTVLCRGDEQWPSMPAVDDSSGRRTALARWIGREDNPLTTRVIVNRIWQQHFGQGIAATASDFGHRGEPPTHPELLDWLTASFVENNWSFKWLHKQILMSSTWRQSAHHPQASDHQQADPAENLLWRSRVRRLNAEQIRDSMLSISGELQSRLGGPSVDAKAPRRSLYVKSFRNNPEKFLHAFDMANGLKSVSERDVTTTPTQALLLINGDYALARAKAFAERLKRRGFDEPSCLIRYAMKAAWGRAATDAEVDAAAAFVCNDKKSIDDAKLVDFCHVLFNSNEFFYID